MKKHSIRLTDNATDIATPSTARMSPCRIDGPFKDDRARSVKGHGKSCGGKAPPPMSG